VYSKEWDQFIHSFILAISKAPLQVLYHSEAKEKNWGKGSRLSQRCSPTWN